MLIINNTKVYIDKGLKAKKRIVPHINLAMEESERRVYLIHAVKYSTYIFHSCVNC